MDAKVCPDGSSVGRIPPDCEFAPCPERSKDWCETSEDCVCGGIDEKTKDCFVGNKGYYDLFVNKEQDCPDFCTGIDGRMAAVCQENHCALVRMAEPPEVGPFIEVVAEPGKGDAPLQVHLTATLRGAEPNDKRFYCAEMDWQFGDGQGQAAMPSCIPYDSSFEIQTKYEADHKYEKPGEYVVTFRLGDLMSRPAKVIVLAERLPPECDEASDCVPAQCCHSADCVIVEKRPDCRTILCTQDCQPGTIDCGGSCACVNNRCVGQNFYPGVDTFSGPRPWQALPE